MFHILTVEAGATLGCVQNPQCTYGTGELLCEAELQEVKTKGTSAGSGHTGRQSSTDLAPAQYRVPGELGLHRETISKENLKFLFFVNYTIRN